MDSEIFEPLWQISDRRKQRNPFCRNIAELILNQIASGMRLIEITKLSGMPSYQVVCKWRRQNIEFNKSLVEAYADRASDIAFEIDLLSIPFRKNSKKLKNLKKKMHRQIGNRYPAQLSKNKKVRNVIINTGINRVQIKAVI